MKSILNNRVAPSAMYVILGILLLICPVRSLDRLCALVGWVLLIYGGGLILQAFLLRGNEIVNRSILAGGLVPALLGIIAILIPHLLTAVVPVLFGIFMIASGVTNAYLAERGRFLRWKLSFLINVLIALCGAFIIFSPRSLVKLMAVVMGATMIMTGISGFLHTRRR